MAAPSNIVWGTIVGDYCRIGIATSLTTTATQTKATVEVWFGSKYSCTDTNNTLYYGFANTSGSGLESVGKVSIGTTHDTGAGWSTTNEVRLKSYSYTITRGTTAQVRYITAKLANIDKVSNVAMYAGASFTVPALAQHKVTYNANGGSCTVSSHSQYYGKTVTLPTPTRTGYTFKGWSTGNDSTEEYSAGASYTVTANVTLYAVWQAITFTVLYNANGGTNAPASQTKTFGVPLTLQSAIPTRTNYTFKGWSVYSAATAVSYAAGASYTTNASVTLYAVWELALFAPILKNFKAVRCDEGGIPSDTGTGMLLTCDYELPTAGSGSFSYARVEYFPADQYGETACEVSTNTEGYTGTWTDYLWWEEGDFDKDTTYSVTLTMEADGLSSTITGTLQGTTFAFDALAGAKGAAVGKNAELEGVFDIGYEARFFKGIRHMVLEPNTDLDNVLMPNTYIGANITTNRYGNCPCNSGTFTLIVEGCGEEGQIRQTYISCSKYKPQRFVRFYYQGAWGDWFQATTEEVVLFEATASTDFSAPITLRYSAAEYKYLEIYYTDNNGSEKGYTKVFSPNGSDVHLQLQEASTSIFLRQTKYSINEKTITPQITTASYVKITSAGVVTTSIGTNYIRVYKVVGIA